MKPNIFLQHIISRTWSFPILMMAVFTLAFIFTLPVQAATIEVDTLTDENDGSCVDGDCSLRDAIATAVAGDTITFNASLNGQTITLTLGHIAFSKNLTITGPGADQLTISGNNANQIFRVTGSSTVNISGLTISNGYHADSGGGIFWQSTGTLTITKSTFSNNNVDFDGGAIVHRGGDIIINECAFTNNTAGVHGGVIFTNADAGAQTLSIDKSTFSDNQADKNGGAIANQIDLTITNSTFSNNTAGVHGGGISFKPFDVAFTTHITNSTLSGNRAKQNGGAIYFQNDGSLSLNNVTITANIADSDKSSPGDGDGGGFFENSDSEATFQNTILSGNSDEGGEAPNCGGDIAGNHLNSQDYNLIQDTTGCTIGGTTTNNITGQNANLAALADNGGDTKTHALNTGSPAIDKGNPAGCNDHNATLLTTDQRSETRPVNGRCDIGAFEASLAIIGGGGVPPGGSGGNEDGNQACGGPCSVGAAGKYCTFCPGATINVPANAVQDGSRVIVSELSVSEAGGNLQIGNSIYDIKIYGPDGQLVTSFDPPLDICIKPSTAALSAAGWNFDNLTLFHSHAGGAWNALVDTYEYDGRLCGQVAQLSLFTLTTPGMPATGFAPGVMTTLEVQPADKAYSAMQDFRLEIPSLGVELPIVGVPLGLAGWDVSWLGDAAGYLEGTAYPTWTGNTAITAHVWDVDNQPGPFVDLHTLQHGDQVVVQAFGQRYIYEVLTVVQVSPENLQALPHEELDVLTLITCQGFNQTSGEYNWRLAVRAILISVE